ncbi:hypothetical protein C6V05_16490 [Burkholderia multivorans]|nr:hypothetical protein C6V05_16490 [Burkholderia multivorans]
MAARNIQAAPETSESDARRADDGLRARWQHALGDRAAPLKSRGRSRRMPVISRVMRVPCLA